MFVNELVQHLQGKTRQINHYYPYGLTIAGIDGDYDDYLNKYTSKELQTGEFDKNVSTGLEMLDYSRSCTFFEGAHEIASLSFGSRFYDPQIGRWHVPDPAEQFHNPYLAMGNNPVVYVDPDGEFIFTALALIIPGAQALLPIAIGADIGAITGGIRGSKDPDIGFWAGVARGTAVGAVGGALSMVGGGTFAANVAMGAFQGSVTGGLDAALWGND